MSWLRPLAQDLLPKLRFYSLIILGESGKGKTRLASKLGMALAHMRVAIFNVEGTSLLRPAIFVIRDFDCIPGIPPCQSCSVILDDSDVQDF